MQSKADRTTVAYAIYAFDSVRGVKKRIGMI